METSSVVLALCEGNSPVTGEFPSQRPVTRSFDVSLSCAWINTEVNNREAGDLRRHRAHYDVIVMSHCHCLHSFQEVKSFINPSRFKPCISPAKYGNSIYVVKNLTMKALLGMDTKATFVNNTIGAFLFLKKYPYYPHEARVPVDNGTRFSCQFECTLTKIIRYQSTCSYNEHKEIYPIVRWRTKLEHYMSEVWSKLDPVWKTFNTIKYLQGGLKMDLS